MRGPSPAELSRAPEPLGAQLGRQFGLAQHPPHMVGQSCVVLSIHQQRTNILRSTDKGETWEEVFSYEPAKVEGGAQGLRDGAFGKVAK